MNGSVESMRYTPDSYIKTRPAAILAVLKAIEIVIGAYALYMILTTDMLFSRAFNGLTDSLSASSNSAAFSGFGNLLSAEGTIIAVINWVSIIGLCLMIVDSIAAILLRITGRFSGVIRFIHTVIYIVMLLGFILSIVGFVSMLISIGRGGVNMAAFSRAFSLAYGALALVGVGLTFGYHRDIASIMKTIGIERRTWAKREVKKSTLPRLCTYYIGITAIPLVITAASWALNQWGGIGANSQLSNIVDLSRLIVDLDTTGFIASIALGLFFIVKFALVGACARVFNNEHM